MGNECTAISIPSNIIEMNTPLLSLPDKPENIYLSEFLPSNSWEKINTNKLSQDPIFIVGYPRSGTTLVQTLIATQKNVYSFPETHFFSLVRGAIVVRNDRIEPDCIERVITRIRLRISFSKNAEEHIFQLVYKKKLSVKMLFETIITDNLIGKLPSDEINRIRWMEKTPDHVKFLDVIFRFYPSAKIIYMVREPGKAILSRRRHFGFNNESNWPIERHIEDWLSGIWTIEKFKQAHPKSVKIVRLEDLAKDTHMEMKHLCDFLQIPYNKDRLSSRQEIAKKLIYPWEEWKSKVFQEISPNLIEDNPVRLSPREKITLQNIAGRELKKFHYSSVENTWRQCLGAKSRNKIKKMKKCVKPYYHNIRELVMPLFNQYKGKINLSDQLQHFYGSHRSGWIFAIQCLKGLHNPRGVIFDAFIERTFAWHSSQNKSHNKPWIGFIHIPPFVPDWFQNFQSNSQIFQSEAWQKSLPNCKGLFALSSYHRNHLENQLKLPVNNLIFPTETPDIKWSWKKFDANRNKKIIQIGWWLRKIHAIFQLPIHSQEYQKIFLKINYFYWEDLIQTEKNILKSEGTFQESMYDTTETILFLPNTDYDRLLSENIIFLTLYDSSANNTVIECIVRNTPLLINPLPAVIEYLGEDYPFYYDSLEEAAHKVHNKDLIFETHRYLVNHRIKEKLTGEYFARSFEESEIYQHL